MDAVYLLWYRTTTRGTIRKLAGVFSSDWEAYRWVVSRPRHYRPGKDGSLWVYIDISHSEQASVGRARSAEHVDDVLRNPEGLRLERREVMHVWD